MKKKILVIDDDPKLLRLVTTRLQKEKFQTHTATDGASGLRAVFEHHPDLVILDVLMPGMDSFEILRRVREMADLPVILLSARASENEIVKGLELGADDYVTKPFRMVELVARIHTCLRHAAASVGTLKPSTLVVGKLLIDLARHRVTLRDHTIDLSPTEFQLLAYLARHRGEVIEHQILLREVWGPEYFNQLDHLHLYVRYLRKKIEKDPAHPEIVKTEHGIGYYIEEAH